MVDYCSLSRSIVSRVAGLATLDAVPIEGRGMSAKVSVVNTLDGKFVVRLKDASWLPHFKKEAWCLERAHEGGISVPRVIECGIENDQAFSIARFVEGTSPIHSGLDRLKIWETLGRYARILNGIRITGFGADMLSDGIFLIPTLQGLVEPELQIIFRDDLWVQRKVITADQLGEVRKLLQTCCDLKGQAGICQWDMCCENALIRGDNLDDIVLLDLDQAVAVLVPQHQLAYVAKGWGLDTEIMKSFIRGYGLSKEEFSDALPTVKRLLVLQAMRSVRWAEDRNPAWLDKNIEQAKKEIVRLLEDENQ